MATETSLADELTQSFLEALRTRNFSQCYQKLVFVETRMANTSLGVSLALYFKGMLANEEKHDAAAAEQFLLQALVMTDEPLWRTRILRALGIAYDYQNLSNKSLETFQSLLGIYESLNQPLDMARTLKNIAIACEKGYARGDLGIDHLLYGESCCNRAHGILVELEANSVSADDALQWEQSTIQNTLGALYMQMQRWPEALVCYQNHLAYASSSASDAFSSAIAKLNLGEIYQLQGSEGWEKAELYYFESLADFRQLNESYEVVGVLANLAALYQQMNKIDLAFEHYEQAIALAEQLRARIGSEAGRSGYFVSLEILYNNAILFYLEQDRAERAFELTEMARSRAFLDSLAQHSPHLAHDWAEIPLTLSQIRSRLAEGDLILAYFCTGLLDTQAEGRQPHAKAKRHRFPQSKIVLFAVTKETIRSYDLAISPNLLRPNHLENVVERHFLTVSILQTLYEKLLQPAETLLLSSVQVFILPHGPLHYVPFSAFMTTNGQPIVSAFGVTLLFAPSATTLLTQHRKMNDEFSIPLLAIGYNNGGGHPLRYAEAESALVAHLHGGISLEGEIDKLKDLTSQALHARILHFSCHGEFSATNPLGSFLAISANERVTAQEIADQMHLHCDLVVLSACESGLSSIRRGDEMLGLVRAFFYTGAQALLVTLWRVDERATLLLMQYFYRMTLAGKDFATALKEAQLYLMHLNGAECKKEFLPIANLGAGEQPPWPADDELPFAEPRYWAGFVLFQQGTHS